MGVTYSAVYPKRSDAVYIESVARKIMGVRCVIGHVYGGRCQVLFS